MITDETIRSYAEKLENFENDILKEYGKLKYHKQYCNEYKDLSEYDLSKKLVDRYERQSFHFFCILNNIENIRTKLDEHIEYVESDDEE